jgi:hypothetical protein
MLFLCDHAVHGQAITTLAPTVPGAGSVLGRAESSVPVVIAMMNKQQ